jgi:hypothetical protein
MITHIAAHISLPLDIFELLRGGFKISELILAIHVHDVKVCWACCWDSLGVESPDGAAFESTRRGWDISSL